MRGKGKGAGGTFDGSRRTSVRWTDGGETPHGGEARGPVGVHERMPPDGFVKWLCGQHSPAERCVFVAG